MPASKFAAFQSWLRRILKPPRQLQFTRLGTYVVFLTLGIGFAAMNTGNNLVYMVFGMMLGVITASGIISEMSLRGIEIDWILPGEITAKEPASVRIILKNTKRKIPSIGLLVQFIDPFESLPIPNKSSESRNPKKISTTSRNFLKTFFLFIPAGGQRSGDIILRPDRRGEYALPAIKVETQFPFGFFKKSLTVEPEEKLLVYPAHVKVPLRVRADFSKRRDQSAPVRGRGDSFWGVRDFAQGDNPRRILWKASAKRNRWMVIETEEDRDREFLLDLRPITDWQSLNAEELEDAVAFTATYLIRSFEQGFSVGIVSEDFTAPLSAQKKDLAQMLRYLALFEPGRIQQFSLQTTGMPADAKRTHANQSDALILPSERGVSALSLWKTR